jgi:hypothetical protein
MVHPFTDLSANGTAKIENFTYLPSGTLRILQRYIGKKKEPVFADSF